MKKISRDQKRKKKVQERAKKERARVSAGLMPIAVGSPYPGPVPKVPGPYMEIGREGGLHLILQMPGITEAEMAAFKASFATFSYLEPSDLPVPIALWAFHFENPLGPIEVNFNARLESREKIETFIWRGGNLLNIIVLDGKIVRAIRSSGLNMEAVNLFRQTLRRQLDSSYSAAEYTRYLNGFYDAFNAAEIRSMSRVFDRHEKKLAPDAAPKTAHTPEDIEKLVETAIGRFIIPGRSYHSRLPAELVPWYCYPPDSGHSILVMLESFLRDKNALAKPVDYLVPAPVKTVLRGYRMEQGFIVVDLPYSSFTGLEVPEADMEYGDAPEDNEPETVEISEPEEEKPLLRQRMMVDDLDKIIPVIAGTPKPSPEIQDKIAEELTCLDVSEVADWMYLKCEEDYVHFDRYTTLAAPWPRVWMEYPGPTKANVGGRIMAHGNAGIVKRIGVYRHTFPLKEENLIGVQYIVFFDLDTPFLRGLLPMAFIETKHDHAGCQVAGYIAQNLATFENSDNGFAKLFAQSLMQEATSALQVSNLAYSLLSDTGTTLKDIVLPTKVAAERTKRGKTPLLFFRRIVASDEVMASQIGPKVK